MHCLGIEKKGLHKMLHGRVRSRMKIEYRRGATAILSSQLTVLWKRIERIGG